jgi:ribonucleoside-triphosphate reductase (formate)
MNSLETPARAYFKGMGEAVADRTINRKIVRNLVEPRTEYAVLPRRDDISLDTEVAEHCRSVGRIYDAYEVLHGDDKSVTVALKVTGIKETETWEDVAARVALGNCLLGDADRENHAHLHHHLRQASVLMSGRHLQHGDATQLLRNLEVFTNCATSALSFMEFYLLLNGSGVGRCYDDAMMAVDWSKMPTVVSVIDMHHKDVQTGEIVALDRRAALHLYQYKHVHEFRVPDSREGWAKAIELIERLTFEEKTDDVLILDFSDVRHRGSPIKGMQDRPASGPGPLMVAIKNIAAMRGTWMPAWRSTMYVDHYSAECVLVGGARRAARMSTKTWRDPGVIEFINVKRPIEYLGKTPEEIEEIQKTQWPMGFLWSSNNSVTVDAEFWSYVRGYPGARGKETLAAHARAVFQALCEASYYDGTGEPGIINVDKLEWKESPEDVIDADFAESDRYKLDAETKLLTGELVRRWRGMQYKMIVNPCGEIALNLLGGYCTIADVVPFHAANDDDAEGAFCTAARALMRVNLMNSVYDREVKRTNRIGVGITGFHEWAWARFNFGWKKIVNESASKPMWLTLSRFKRAIDAECIKYAAELGVVVPHTNTTFKPAGTTSKLFGLTEGAHLPSMREYIRWVQFRNDDPLIETYAEKGYPIKRLKTYSGTTIVGFPTAPMICTLGMGDELVTAAEATPEEQYEFLRLLEKYWIVGVDENEEPLTSRTGNQISYTLKYDPKVVDFKKFQETLLAGQSSVRCCSVMPQSDTSAYEYQPEEMVEKSRYEMVCAAIKEDEMKEDIGLEHVDCDSGACPISFNENQ